MQARSTFDQACFEHTLFMPQSGFFLRLGHGSAWALSGPAAPRNLRFAAYADSRSKYML